jgi:hypothetical protein
MRFGLLLMTALPLAALGGCGKDGQTHDRPVSSEEAARFDDPSSLGCWPERGSWPQFAHDPLHTGRTELDFGSADLDSAWEFHPAAHVRMYQPGFSVWSSAVAGTVDGGPLVIAGHYDRIVYAIDCRP